MPREHGTGTIEKTRSGKYVPRLPGVSGKSLPSRLTKEEAERDLDDALTIIREKGLRPLPVGRSLATYGRAILTARLDGPRSNASNDLSRWTTHVEQTALASCTVESLTRQDVARWVAERSKAKVRAPHRATLRRPRTVSRSLVVDALRILRIVTRAAVLEGLRADDPTVGVKVERHEGLTHEPWTHLAAGELVRFLALRELPASPQPRPKKPATIRGHYSPARPATQPIHPEDHDAALFAVYSGLRQGEQWTLHVRDVDAETGRVVVRYGGRKGTKLRPTKGKRPRTLQLLPPALEALRRQLLRLAAKEATPPLPSTRCVVCRSRHVDHQGRDHAYKRRPTNPRGLVWPSTAEQHPGAFRAVEKPPPCFDAWVEAASLRTEDRGDPAPVTWHTLRHTFATLALAGKLPGCEGEGWRLERVSAYLGHKSIAITQRYADVAALL
jgi:integrase